MLVLCCNAVDCRQNLLQLLRGTGTEFSTMLSPLLTLRQRGHRIAGAVESAVGMLMFGWSTALLVRVVQRTDRDYEK